MSVIKSSHRHDKPNYAKPGCENPTTKKLKPFHVSANLGDARIGTSSSKRAQLEEQSLFEQHGGYEMAKNHFLKFGYGELAPVPSVPENLEESIVSLPGPA